MRIFLTALLLSATVALPSHAAPVQDASGLAAVRTTFLKLPAWQEDNHGEALGTFQASCTKLQAKPAQEIVGEGMMAAPASVWHAVCSEANRINPADHVAARTFFERAFVPFALAYNGNPKGKFTGYYEPLMHGTWQRKSPTQEAIYGKPADLPSGGAVYPFTRRDIDNGALAGKGLERMFINDPVDAFFLHVQGSGRVLMDTGETVALRFAGKNNQPYTAIGKVLIENGALKKEDVSAPAIRKWLKDNPEKARDVMQHNDSFVFFSVEPEVEGGPVGAQNVPLTPERSLAVDTAFIPLGMPLWLSSVLPNSLYADGELYRRLMVAQDKGSAITGAIRGDVFFGYGDRAADLAGHMNSEGYFAALVPQEIARRMDSRIY